MPRGKVRVDADWVQRLAAEIGARLGDDAVVRRAVRWCDGLALALRREAGDCELAMLTTSGTAWAWWLEPGARATLLREAAALGSDLAERADFGGRDGETTALDALRAWVVRASPTSGAWGRLEGMRLTSVQARGGDRVLELGLERRDAVGRRETLQVTAELFDRGGNVRVVDATGTLVASVHDRPPASRRAIATAAAAAPAQVTWSPERGVHAADAAASPAIGLATAAHLALATQAAAELARGESRRLRRDVAHLERLLEKLRSEDADAGAAQRCRQDAELLAANLHRVRRGQARIELEDWFADNAPRVLELDPELSPQENVARLFKRAKRGERGHDTIVARRSESEARLATAQAALAALEDVHGWAQVVTAAAPALRAQAGRTATAPLTALWAPGGPEREAAPRPQPKSDDGPGRRFVLDGDWEVRVGRSNAENDTLTHRFAAPDDVWLHASGVAGSHVVLRMRGRSDNPPRDVLERAAAIAARFSKAKHAGTVPVIWTRKRHVRKPRGAPAGLAVCTHEKTVFVKPGLPPGADTDA